MNVREKYKSAGIFSFLLVLVVMGLLVFGIKGDIAKREAMQQIRMDYQRCFTEMVQYVDDLQLSLEKSKFVNDPRQMM
jgi:hypothetical protein